MTINELNGKIKSCENQIYDCDCQIREYMAKIQKLEDLECSLKKALDNLRGHQFFQQNMIKQTIVIAQRPKVISDYFSDMSDLLNGNSYHDVAYGLQESQEKARRKQQEYTEQIEDLESIKNDYENEIEDLQQEICML